MRKRWLVGGKPLFGAFGGWAAAILVMGATAFTLGTLNEGRVASRIVAAIIANAEESGKTAVVSDGGLDELFFFTLPEDIKLISLARERDPAYGRELAAWVTVQGPKSSASVRCPLSSVQTDDLAFAAELGPRALVDEWMKLDKAGFEAKVATVANFFPTGRPRSPEGTRGAWVRGGAAVLGEGVTPAEWINKTTK